MKTILITGANRGIGLELVRQYLIDGWKVIACCRNPASAKKLEELATHNPGLLIKKLDVANADEIQQVAKSIESHAIDILFNNAGIWEPDSMRLGSIEPEPWLNVFRVNTIAPLLLTQALMKQVAHNRLKIIANMSSSMASIADNTRGDSYAYRSSKSALNAVTKSLAIDLAPQGIVVVALDPGWVKTDMGGPDAFITPRASVSSIKKVLATLTLAESGNFIRYDGAKLAW